MYTIQSIRNFAPKYFLKGFFELKQYASNSSAPQIEARGDVDEIMDLLMNSIKSNDMEELTRVIRFKNFAMASCSVIGHQTFSAIEECQEFKDDYPAIYNLILIWAWS